MVKVYTFVGCLEALSGVLASPVCSNIYKYSLVTFPGAVKLYEASCMLVVLVLFLVVDTLIKKQTRL